MPDYYLTLRPASIGTYPTYSQDGRSLHPEIVADYWPPRRTPEGWNHYATVRYAEPLPCERIWRYDLRPAAAVEAAHYVFWREGMDVDQQAELEREWLSAGRDLLVRQAPYNNLAQAALVLLDKEASNVRNL